MVQIAFPLRSNPGRYKIQGSPALFNAYVERVGEENKSQWSLVPCAALSRLGTDVDGSCRGMIWLEEDAKLYAVYGFSLYDVAENGTKTRIGAIPGTGPVYLARNDANATQVAIVADGKAWQLTGGALSIINLQDDEGNVILVPQGVTQCGGYFVFWDANAKMFASDLNSTSVDALAFATAEADPDNLVACWGSGKTLYAIGTTSVEVWTVSGSADFPFVPVQGAVLRFGSNSPHSIADVDSAIFMVCSDHTVRAISGYQDRVVSSPEVSRLIEAEADKSAIYAFSHLRGENRFYTLQGTNWTREYNNVTGAWHNRFTGDENKAWKGAFCAPAFNSHYFGSNETGAIYKGVYDTFTEDGKPVIWGARFSITHDFPNGLSFNRLSLNMETGHGTATEPGKLLVRWSDDDARTFKGERIISLGKIGQYAKPVDVWNMGSCGRNGRTFDLRISSDVIRAIAMVDIDAQRIGI
jgi:hypothetical protein